MVISRGKQLREYVDAQLRERDFYKRDFYNALRKAYIFHFARVDSKLAFVKKEDAAQYARDISHTLTGIDRCAIFSDELNESCPSFVIKGTGDSVVIHLTHALMSDIFDANGDFIENED